MDTMLDTKIGQATTLLTFRDGVQIKKGTLCTILGEQPDGAGGILIKVVFRGETEVRLVKPEEVEE